MLLKNVRGLFHKLQLNLAKHFEKAPQRELCLKNQLADMAKQLTESGNIYPWANHLDRKFQKHQTGHEHFSLH